MTASTPQPERDTEARCTCYHPTNCSICARRDPNNHRAWCPSAPSEPPTAAQEGRPRIYGRTGDPECDAPTPPADAPEQQDDERELVSLLAGMMATRRGVHEIADAVLALASRRSAVAEPTGDTDLRYNLRELCNASDDGTLPVAWVRRLLDGDR